MADGYGDILGGFDPYAGQRLAAAMSATLGADPGRLAYSSGPVGQALGQISGGFERARAIDLANTLAGELMAALPDLASAYTGTDPYQWAAHNPQASPLARAMILGTSPMDVAKTREAAINAAMAGLNLRGFTNLQGAAGTPAAAAPIAAPANRRIAPVTAGGAGGGPSPLSGVDPHYPGGGTDGGATNFDTMSADQLQQFAKGPLTPAQRYQLARWYMQRQAADAAPTAMAARATG
jgi:hypothetical protein